MSKLIRFAALTLLLSMIIAACGASATPTTAPATVAPTTAATTAPTTATGGDPTATTEVAATATTEVEATATPEGPGEATEVPPTATPIEIIDEGAEAAAEGKDVVKWFVGLGTGGNLEQVEKEQEVVAEYNESNTDNIYIALNVIPNAEAYNVLATQIAAGTPPDIIGPVGIRGISFAGENVRVIDDLIESAGVDLSKYDEGSLKAYQNEKGEQFGLPYAVFPSFILVNRDLFDEAGLPYPPQAVGEQYEGKDWNMETLRELAMQLTVDANGVAANEEGFDPKNIVQFGFIPQWQGNILNTGSFFGAGDLTADDNSATIPEEWKASWKWFYNGRHVDHFIPDSAYENSDEFGQSNVWSTGKVAMAFTHLWYTCCFTGEQVPNWDLAVIPEYNGKTTAKLHADTFAIMNATKKPEATFKVYMFLLNNEELRQLYGGLPPVISEQQAYFDALSEKYAPNEINWDVALEMLKYPDIPSHEQNVPNYLKFQDRLAAFDQLANATAGLDLDQEIEKLETDLTAIFQGN